MKIIGFVGMPGSGKSEASRVARKMGLKVVVMGDVIRKEASRLGLEPSDENLGQVGNALRSREGPEAIAVRSLSLAGGQGHGLVVVDGIRSRAEVEYFRANSEQFCLVDVWAPAEERLKRIASRGRSDDGVPGPKGDGAGVETDGVPEQKTVRSCHDGLHETARALEMRECRELGWGMCDAIEVADVRVKNLGSLDDLRRSIEDVLREFGPV